MVCIQDFGWELIHFSSELPASFKQLPEQCLVTWARWAHSEPIVYRHVGRHGLFHVADGVSVSLQALFDRFRGCWAEVFVAPVEQMRV